MCAGLMGLFGVLIGGGITYFLQKSQYGRETKQQRERDAGRRSLLKQMLDDPNWQSRSMSRLSRVIGASPDETARLLIDLDARGLIGDDEKWGYIKDHPLHDEQ